MNIETIQMDPRIARIHFSDYRKKCREHRLEREKQLQARAHEAGKELGKIRIEKSLLEKEDEQLLKVYRELSRGQQLINLNHVMKAVGVFQDTYLPKLAIARAHKEKCWFSTDGGPKFYDDDSAAWSYGQKTRKATIRIPRSCFPSETTDTSWRFSNNKPRYPVEAIVPPIPAHLRPAKLEEFYILWEAEWKKAPPVDPILLKRLTDTMFVIVAQWNLSDVEQMVLEGRFR